MFPPKRVLAAVDFSEPSRVALRCAARLAKQCRADLHVLHAEDPMLAAAARESGIDLAGETRDELAGFMQSAAPAGEWTPVHHIVSGQAVEVIGDIAQRERADVIVIGMHGMSGAERTVFGSTTEGVLRKADTSVLVVPDSWTAPRPELPDLTGTGPVVAAIDLSMHAIAAAKAASRLAALLGTSVDAVHIVPPLPVLARWSAHADAAMRRRVEAAGAELRSALRHVETNVPLDLHVDAGHVAERLAERVKAADGRHPILVLGRRTHRERGGAPGSTAYRVLTRVTIPVLMYMPDE